MDNVTIPNIMSPIYTLAMRDLVICMSGIDVLEKVCLHYCHYLNAFPCTQEFHRFSQRKLEKFIGFMGGMHVGPLGEKVTHLITEDIFTKKYEVSGIDIRGAAHVASVHEQRTDGLLIFSWPRCITSR